MSASDFAAELAQFGPQGARPKVRLEEARTYCERLARRHYENFTVASWLLPRHLKQHIYNIYAYCRWADDLADETGGGVTGLALLDWWEGQLQDCYRGRAQHPVFLALAETIEQFEIPQEPFLDLLSAFRQDQRQNRYETFEELLGYCRRSANPVGRLVLHLGRCHEPENVRLSDSICTGLQLANFWQDVARDWERGRVYLPTESRRRFGYRDEMLSRRECNSQFRELLAYEVQRAESYLLTGKPLIQRVPRELRIDVSLFVRGGLAVLTAIRRTKYDVWSKRPTVNKLAKLKLLLSAWAGLP
jgi:squalene synthase HpnC